MSLAGKVYSQAVALFVVPGVSQAVACLAVGFRSLYPSPKKTQIGACVFSNRLFITSTHGSDTPRPSMDINRPCQ